MVITPDMDEILPNLLGLENRSCPLCNYLYRANGPQRREAGRKLASYAQPAFRPYRLSVVKIGKTKSGTGRFLLYPQFMLLVSKIVPQKL